MKNSSNLQLSRYVDNTLVNVGAEAPAPRLAQVVKIRIITPASDLLHIGLVSTMMKTLFPPHPRGASVKILNSGTTVRKSAVKTPTSLPLPVARRLSRESQEKSGV